MRLLRNHPASGFLNVLLLWGMVVPTLLPTRARANIITIAKSAAGSAALGAVGSQTPQWAPDQLPGCVVAIDMVRAATHLTDTATAATGTTDVQTLTGGTGLTGSGTLTLNGQTTSALANNTTNAQLATALAALAGVGTGNVTVTGGPLNSATPLVITFGGALVYGPQNAITINIGTWAVVTPAIVHTTPGVAVAAGATPISSGSLAGYIPGEVAGGAALYNPPAGTQDSSHVPTYTVNNALFFGGKPCLQYTVATTDFLQFDNTPAMQTLNVGDTSVFIVYAQPSSGVNAIATLYSHGTTSGLAVSNFVTNGSLYLASQVDFSNRSPVSQFPAGTTVKTGNVLVEWETEQRAGTTNVPRMWMYTDGAYGVSHDMLGSAGVASVPSPSSTMWRLGNDYVTATTTTGNVGFLGAIGAVYVFNRHVSDEERRRIEAYLSSTYSVTLMHGGQPQDVDMFAPGFWTLPASVVVCGDSLSAGDGTNSTGGAGGDGFNSWLYGQADPLFPSVFQANYGSSGQTLATASTQITTRELKAGRNGHTKILYVWLGTNDFNSNPVAGQVTTNETNIQTIVNAAKSANWYVIVTTMLPRDGSSHPANDQALETVRLSWNAWLVANAVPNGGTLLNCDRLIDIGSDATYGIGPVAEVYTIHSGGGGTNVTYSLNGVTSGSSSVTTTAATLAGVLNTMSNLNTVVNEVTATGGPLGTSDIVLTFPGLVSSPQLGLLSVNNTGGSTVTVTETTVGRAGQQDTNAHYVAGVHLDQTGQQYKEVTYDRPTLISLLQQVLPASMMTPYINADGTSKPNSTQTAIKTQTDKIATNSGDSPNAVTAQTGTTSNGTAIATVQTTANAIKAKTDNLPASPAAVSDVTTATSTLATSSALSTAQTAITAIKAKTDLIATNGMDSANAVTAQGNASTAASAAASASASAATAATNTTNIPAGVWGALTSGGAFSTMNSIGSLLFTDINGTISGIPAGVLDATASAHNTAGTIGAKINAAGSAGDPWATLTSSESVSGSFGALLKQFTFDGSSFVKSDNQTGVNVTQWGGASLPTAFGANNLPSDYQQRGVAVTLPVGNSAGQISLNSGQVTVGTNNDKGNTSLAAAETLLAHTGTAQAGSATTITLANTASALSDYYQNQIIRIDSGTGAGQVRPILAGNYVGSTRVLTVATWVTVPDNTSVYSILSTAGASAGGGGGGGTVTVSTLYRLGAFPQTVPLSPVRMTAGDTASALQMPLTDDSGAALSFTDSPTVTFTMRLSGAGSSVIAAAAGTITTADAKGIRYATFKFSSGTPVPSAGTYTGTFSVDGTTFPSGRAIPIQVQAAL